MKKLKTKVAGDMLKEPGSTSKHNRIKNLGPFGHKKGAKRPATTKRGY